MSRPDRARVGGRPGRAAAKAARALAEAAADPTVGLRHQDHLVTAHHEPHER